MGIIIDGGPPRNNNRTTKKRVRMMSDGYADIELKGRLWGFTRGDIITCDRRVSVLFKNKAVVEGFRNNVLYVQIKDEAGYRRINGPKNIILLKRPSWKFKVGDEVKAMRYTPKGQKGTIIVLDPGGDNDDVLVEFEDWQGGHDGLNRETWYPEKYRNEAKSRWWFCNSKTSNSLKLLKSAKSEKFPKFKAALDKQRAEELKKSGSQKPRKKELTPQDLKIIDAIDKMVELFKKARKTDGKYPIYGFKSENRELVGPKVVDKTEDIKKTFRSLAKVFYYLVSGESAHTNISFLLDDWPRLKDDNVWYIISMLFGWEKDGKRHEYKKKEEAIKDLRDLKEKIKSRAVTDKKLEQETAEQKSKVDLTKLEKIRMSQAKKFLKLGFHKAADLDEDDFLFLVPPPEDKPKPLLVVSKKFISLKKQLELAGIKTELDLRELKNTKRSPQGLIYWIYEIEDGRKMLGKSSEQCIKEFQKQNRKGLIVEQGIALIAQKSRVSNHHNIDLPGSWYRSSFVPYLWFCDGRPKLSWASTGSANDEWGSASCNSNFEKKSKG